MKTLRETFVGELKDMYDAEKQLLKALPEMAEAAKNSELRGAFEEHKTQTQEHIARLEKVFEAFSEAPTGKKCKGMAGLIEEGKDLIEEGEGDASLIAAAQKAEHYEISAYGTLVAWAAQLGESRAVELLEQTLDEESDTDEKLTLIAETIGHDEAETEGGEDEDVEDVATASARM